MPNFFISFGRLRVQRSILWTECFTWCVFHQERDVSNPLRLTRQDEQVRYVETYHFQNSGYPFFNQIRPNGPRRLRT